MSCHNRQRVALIIISPLSVPTGDHLPAIFQENLRHARIITTFSFAISKTCWPNIHNLEIKSSVLAPTKTSTINLSTESRAFSHKSLNSMSHHKRMVEGSLPLKIKHFLKAFAIKQAFIRLKTGQGTNLVYYQVISK